MALNSYAQPSGVLLAASTVGMQGPITTEYSYELRKKRCATCS